MTVCQEKWRQISGRTAWCQCCGRLRHGTWLDEVYQDDEGKPIKLTSTGYYHPIDGWQPGPVPTEFLRVVYGEPYTYEAPG